jgi:hypothetical protein
MKSNLKSCKDLEGAFCALYSWVPSPPGFRFSCKYISEPYRHHRHHRYCVLSVCVPPGFRVCVLCISILNEAYNSERRTMKNYILNGLLKHNTVIRESISKLVYFQSP